MNSKTKKQLLSLLVSLAMAASVSFTPVYAGDEDVIDVTIEIPTGNAESSYTYEVSSDGTSTVSETSGSSDESGSDDNTASETSTDSGESSDADSGAADTAAEAASETTETADGTDTTASETADTDATDAPAEATDTPEATTAPAAAVGVTATSADTSAADEVQALIDALPSVDKLADMDTDELNEVYTAFLAACEAYDALSEDEQAEVDDSKLDELADYFNGAYMVASTESGGITCDTTTTSGTYIWDFSNASLTASTEYTCEGLTVQVDSANNVYPLQSKVDESFTSESDHFNGIYKTGNWVPEGVSDGNGGYTYAAATQYVKIEAPADGVFSFKVYFDNSSTHRIYYDSTSSPNKNTGLLLYNTTSASSSETKEFSLSMKSGDTYYISIFRGNASYYETAMYDFTFTTDTPIDGAYDTDSNKYTWAFDTTGYFGFATVFDYSDYYASIRVGLGSGDQMISANDASDNNSYGIYFSNRSVSEYGNSSASGYENLGETGRYIMVNPTVSGTISFDIYSKFSGGTSRLYYAKLSNETYTFSSIDLSKIDKAASGSDVSSYAVAYGQVSSNNLSNETSQTLTMELEKGYIYIFYTFNGNNTLTTYITDMTFTPSSADLGIVTGKNIDLTSGEIVMNVYVDSDVINTSGTQSSTVYYNKPEIASETTTYTDSDNEEHTVYAVSQKILASEMADEIAITIPLSGGGTYTYTTSVKDYADYAKTNWDSTTYAKELAVLNAMLDYGSAVQALATGASGDSLANVGEYQSGFDDVTANTIKSAGGTKSTGTTGSFTPKLQSMNMNFNYNFNLGLTFDSSIDGCTVAVTVDGKTCDNISAALSTDKMSVIVAGLNAEQLSKELKVTLTSGSGSTYTITTTGLYYARLLVDGSKTTTSDAQKLLGKALYKYVSAVNSLNTTDTTEEA